MSEFTLTVNGKPVEIKSTETQNLLKNVLTVETPLSDSLAHSLSQTDNKGRAYRDFYPQGLIEHGAPEDVFELTLTSKKGILTGKATRQALYNRLVINNSRLDYSVSIERVSAEGAEPVKTSNKGEADFA